MDRRQVTPSIFTLSGVLYATECQQLIEFAEAQGFEAATINAWEGPRFDTEVRNSSRSELSSRAEAEIRKSLVGACKQR